jgi:hypothetical protein
MPCSFQLSRCGTYSALGLGTWLTAAAALGWRHVATVTGTTLIILAVVAAGLAILR